MHRSAKWACDRSRHDQAALRSHSLSYFATRWGEDARGGKMLHSGNRGRDTRMFTLYSMQRSGNCYKVRLALAQLALPYNLVEIDILKGDTRTPDFLAKNPMGHVPLLEAAPGRYLPESGAILWYLAGGTPLAPENRLDRAETLQWMFFEQHSLEPYVGSAHFCLCSSKAGASCRCMPSRSGWRRAISRCA